MDALLIVKKLVNIGLSEKAAKLYIAALELGEGSVMHLAKHAHMKRTTAYYDIEELQRFGALTATKRGRKILYRPEPPAAVIQRVRERVGEFEHFLPELESIRKEARTIPKMYFLYGTAGVKQIWEKLLSSRTKQYWIATDAVTLRQFLSARYIEERIVKRRGVAGITSRQLITDSVLAREITAKDRCEGRTSKILPTHHQLPTTIIVNDELTALIAPKNEDLILVIESPSLARTQRSLLELVWSSLP